MSSSPSFPIPPLSDSFSRLLALDESERYNVKLLDLLVQKDPGAVAGLLNLANSARYRAGSAKEVVTVRDALQVLGVEVACGFLLALWALDGVEVRPELLPARRWLTRHVFSVLATTRKLMAHAPTGSMSPLHLQLTVLVDKLALATALSPQESTMGSQALLLGQVVEGHHALHQVPALTPLFERSVVLAQHWSLPSPVLSALQELSTWRSRGFDLSAPAQALLISELMLDARVSDENGPLAPVIDEMYETASLAHTVMAARVALATLAVSL